MNLRRASFSHSIQITLRSAVYKALQKALQKVKWVWRKALASFVCRCHFDIYLLWWLSWIFKCELSGQIFSGSTIFITVYMLNRILHPKEIHLLICSPSDPPTKFILVAYRTIYWDLCKKTNKKKLMNAHRIIYRGSGLKLIIINNVLVFFAQNLLPMYHQKPSFVLFCLYFCLFLISKVRVDADVYCMNHQISANMLVPL